MSHLTKEQLRDALVANGVKSPPASAKKEEFIALYRENVSENGVFSSDDEDNSPLKASPTKAKRTPSQSSKGSPAKRVSKKADNSLVVDGVNLNELTDDELFRMLKAEGVENLGPIVETTRRIYLKKLAGILAEKLGTNGSQEEEEEEEEGEVEEIAASPSPKKSSRSSKKASKSSKSFTNGLASYSADEEEAEVIVTNRRKSGTPRKLPSASSLRNRFENELDKSKERFTPTPRRSIHTYKVTESTKRTATKLPDGQTVHDYSYSRKVEDSDKAGCVAGAVLRLLPKLIMLVIFAIVLYYTIQKYPDVPARIAGNIKSLFGSKSAAPAISSGGSPAPPPARDDLGDQPSIGNV